MTAKSITEAKDQLPRLVHEAERGRTVHITRRGKPVAVLLSEQDYTRLCRDQRTQDFWTLVEEMRADPAFEPVDWSPEEVESWRQRDPTDSFEWPE